MKLLITTAALALFAASAPAAAQTAQPAAPASGGGIITHKPKLSDAAGQSIVDLQQAIGKNDAAVPAKLAAAKAAAKTADDRYAISLLELQAATTAKNEAAVVAGLEDMLASGSVKPEEQLGIYEALSKLYTSLKQDAKAAQAMQHIVQLDPNNIEAIASQAEAKVAAGQPAAAIPLFQQGIKIQQASGQKAPEAWYKRATSVAYNAKLPSAAQLSRDWVAAYPKPENYHDAIAIYRNLNQPDVQGTLDLLRLESALGALKSPGEYALLSEAAAEQFNYAEAQAALDAGVAAHVVDLSIPQFRDIANGLKGKQKATAADLEAAAKMSPAPAKLLGIGDRYYGMGDYAKAADIYRQVMTKPGADKDLANLHLGMALARAGDKAGATAALNAVTGSRAEIAKYWLLYAQQHG